MRIDIREVDVERVFGAFKRRLVDIPEMVSWSLSDFGKIARSRMSTFGNLYKGRRCFIVANGPSLKFTNISYLKDEVTFSMNRAYLMYSEWGFFPTFYTCINELVIEQFASDIQSLPMPKFINYNRRHLFRDNNSLNYFRLPPRLRETFSVDCTNPMTSGGTVTYATLQLAYFMGFSEVIIVGMDHKFAEKGTPGKIETRTAIQDQSHAHPNYFPRGIKWQLPDLLRSEHAYSLARRVFEADGRTIYDATVDGACTVFKKRDFSSFFSFHKN